MPLQSIIFSDGASIQYQLERRQRRTVGMRIGADGLIVHAPKRLSLTELERLLLSKAVWIRKKLEFQQQRVAAPVLWQNNEALMLLGNTIYLRLEFHGRARGIQFNPVGYPAGTLLLAMPMESQQNQAQATAQPQHQELAQALNLTQTSLVKKKVQNWYRRYATEDFSRRLALFSTKLGVEPPTLFLSSAKTRWGSCNSKKEVRLNWRLIQAPPHIINYVICHELAHLREMNHSAKFWAVVASLFPAYKQAESELSALSAQLHAID